MSVTYHHSPAYPMLQYPMFQYSCHTRILISEQPMHDSIQCMKCLTLFGTQQTFQVHIQTCLTQEQSLLLTDIKTTYKTPENNGEVCKTKTQKTKRGKETQRHKKKKIHSKDEKYFVDKDGNKVKRRKKKHKLSGGDEKRKTGQERGEGFIQNTHLKIKEEPGIAEGIKAAKPLTVKKKQRSPLFTANCPVCDIHFTRANRYIDHLRVHAGKTLCINAQNKRLYEFLTFYGV